MVVTLSRMTLPEFLALPDIETSPAWEFVNQVAVQKSMPTLFHSRLQKRLLPIIDQSAQGYEALPELRCVLATTSVVPDVTIVAKERLPQINQAIEGAPDWIIEILSPDQRATRVITKIQACLEAGTKLAWLIDPLEEVVMAFWADRPLVILRGDHLLPVLPDIQLKLTPIEIFAWMKG
ncbi:MAG: Uma2 family endonuclease [Pseudanabaenaceae cyanobacterium bins.39]|nr:Uma2 family endonuclease [Pseudanabaenaceae cyanobacterium bins.39]